MPDEKRKHPVDEYKGLVLVIDDEPNVCNAVKAYLEPENFYV
ncbi:MAG TPA: response regulator transcription factor, partial [candidate division Zixibacteria bacterium]|nr:response regulator transcription factor [candidate division Zixibacteria bacterium]